MFISHSGFRQRLLRKFEDGWAIGRTARQEKMQVKATLKRFSEQMKPGWYRIERKLAYRIGEDPPRGLMGTKNNRPAKFRQRLKWSIVNRVLAPIMVLRIPHKREGNGRYSQLLLTNAGDIKLFDVRGGEVLTHVVSEERYQRLAEAHSVLGRALPVVSLRALGKQRITEPFLSGLHLNELQEDAQKVTYEKLIRSYKAFVNSELQVRFGLERAKATFGYVKNAAGDHVVGSLLEKYRQEILGLLAQSPMMPSHRDLGGHNIIVSQGEPQIIDLEHFSPMVFFFDLLSVPLQISRDYELYGLLSALNSGEFDEPMDSLFTAANVCKFSSNRHIVWLAFLVPYLELWLQRREGSSIHPSTTVLVFCEQLMPFLLRWDSSQYFNPGSMNRRDRGFH